MPVHSTAVRFEGQDLYVGIDVHRTRWAVSVRMTGLTLKGFSMNPAPDELVRLLHRSWPGATCHLVYEAGFCGFWIQRAFAHLGVDCIVINPADVPTAHKEHTGKRDAIDAAKLARELESGSLTPLYIPEEASQHLRSLCRFSTRVVQQMTRTKNRIKGLLYYNGIALPRHSSQWPARFIAQLRALPVDQGPGRATLHLMLDELEEHRRRRTATLQALRAAARSGPAATILPLLLSVPGIGRMTGMMIDTELIDSRRVRTFDHLTALVGLIPSVYASGDTERVRGVTPGRNAQLQDALIEAAWVAVRHDPVLLLTFQRLSQRMKTQQAIIRIAATLLHRIRHVWLQEVPSVTAVIE